MKNKNFLLKMIFKRCFHPKTPVIIVKFPGEGGGELPPPLNISVIGGIIGNK